MTELAMVSIQVFHAPSFLCPLGNEFVQDLQKLISPRCVEFQCSGIFTKTLVYTQ
jgi:hypothetical protein